MARTRAQNLAVRLASAAVLLPLAIWLTSVGGLAFAVLCAAAAALGAAELLKMSGRFGFPEVLASGIAGALPILAWQSGSGGQFLPPWIGLGLFGALMVILAASLFRGGSLEPRPRAVASAALAWIYCGLGLAIVVAMRSLPGGLGWVCLAMSVTFMNDTWAYFAGKLWGRHKLYEKVSPNKSWEGFAAGTVGSVVGAFFARAIWVPQLSPLDCVVVGLPGAVLGPMGDLCESMLKRAFGVKDSGEIIPGHGGILDRLDAFLFVSPWIYLFARYLAH
jgi:phosphatidate cytidylyltransferase